MKVFQYTIIDNNGKLKTGKIEAADDIQAANLLREKDAVITALREKEVFDLSKYFNKFQKVPEQEKIMFARQLATMITAGLSLGKALEVLEQQTSNKKMKRVISDMASSIEGGLSLSQCMDKHREVFSDIFVSLVKAGEASGKLDMILTRLADTLEKDHRFKSQTKGALIYPVIVLIFMLIVIFIMFVFVIPPMTGMFNDMGVELPLPTKILIMISTFMSQNVFVVVGGVVFFAVGINKIGKSPRGQHFFAEIALKAPIFGKIIRQVQFANFARILSLLISSGLPLLEALDISRETLTNIKIKEGVALAAKGVEKGAALSEPLKANPIFPVMLSQMVAIGEETGKLDEVLDKVSNFFEQEASDSTKNLSTAMEPLIMVFLGVGVAFLIISIILPIYKLTTSF